MFVPRLLRSLSFSLVRRARGSRLAVRRNRPLGGGPSYPPHLGHGASLESGPSPLPSSGSRPPGACRPVRRRVRRRVHGQPGRRFGPGPSRGSGPGGIRTLQGAVACCLRHRPTFRSRRRGPRRHQRRDSPTPPLRAVLHVEAGSVATAAPLRPMWDRFRGGVLSRNRTCDRRVMSWVLCQLSYAAHCSSRDQTFAGPRPHSERPSSEPTHGTRPADLGADPEHGARRWPGAFSQQKKPSGVCRPGRPSNLWFERTYSRASLPGCRSSRRGLG